jgi:hypothetical protein
MDVNKNFESILEKLLNTVGCFMEKNSITVDMRAYMFNCQLKKEKIKNDEITTQEIIFDKDNLKLRFIYFLNILFKERLSGYKSFKTTSRKPWKIGLEKLTRF